MSWNVMFFVNSALLSVGLAMDAFSVSLVNGMNEKNMKKGRMCLIAGVYAFFQFIMPFIGWICVHTIEEYFTAFTKYIPWIALILLLYIGIKMIIEGIRGTEEKTETDTKLTGGTLLMQGIATSIDALSVGFTTAEYGLAMALVSCLIIAAGTFIICMSGLAIGKKAGAHLGKKASILGGIILICIGIEIFVTGVFLK